MHLDLSISPIAHVKKPHRKALPFMPLPSTLTFFDMHPRRNILRKLHMLVLHSSLWSINFSFRQ